MNKEESKSSYPEFLEEKIKLETTIYDKWYKKRRSG
jgi:hypothetical protein